MELTESEPLLYDVFPSRGGWSQPRVVDLAYGCTRLWSLLLSNVLDFIGIRIEPT